MNRDIGDRLYVWQQEAGVLRYLPILWFFHFGMATLEPATRTPFLNWGSVVLEIAGGAIVLWQLNEISSKFKNNSIIAGAVSWVKRCPLWFKPKNITLCVSDVGHGHTCVMDALLVGNRTLEQKVDFLMDEVKRLDTSIRDTKQELSGEVKTLKAEHSNLSRTLQDIKADLQDAMVGDVHWEVFGALIITQGVIMGAMA